MTRMERFWLRRRVVCRLRGHRPIEAVKEWEEPAGSVIWHSAFNLAEFNGYGCRRCGAWIEDWRPS